MTIIEHTQGEGQRMNRAVRELTVTIPASETDSPAVPVGGYSRGSYQLPAAFTGATVTVKYSNDGSAWTTVPAEGTEAVPQTVSADGTYRLPIMTFTAKFFQLVSASSEAAARDFIVVLRS